MKLAIYLIVITVCAAVALLVSGEIVGSGEDYAETE